MNKRRIDDSARGERTRPGTLPDVLFMCLLGFVFVYFMINMFKSSLVHASFPEQLTLLQLVIDVMSHMTD